MTPPKTGADRLKDLWLPIGPTTVLGGQAAESPNITGRVLEVAVSPNGKRVYAATANGGVWYSNDEGSSWLGVGNWVTTPQAEQLDRYANALTCGSVVVDWDTTANGENDTVFVGTGETIPKRRNIPGGSLGGIGVLQGQGVVALTRADPFAAVWTREGKALEGAGIYRLAMRPGHPDELAAAASNGFYMRSGAAGPDNWTKVTVAPFDGERVVTDVVWTATHVWVALHSRGVWRAAQPAGPFTKVDLPGLQDGRVSLAVSSDGTIVYALGDGPRLWRVTGTTATRVSNVPAALFGGGSDSSEGEEEEEEEAGRGAGHPEHALPPEATGNQAFYDMVLAVDPDHPEVIVLGGSAVEVSNASLFKCTVQGPGGSPHLDYSPAHDAATDSPAKDPTFIGFGVHPDVHGATFAKRGGTLDLWITCDGGIYRSTRGGRNYTWQERNNGLAVTEPGFLACHPTSEAVVVVGTQDNGILERTGDTTWTWSLAGDGGGVAFHPAHGERYLGQATSASWRSKDGKTTQPVLRTLPPHPDHETDENKKASFYSAPGVVAAKTADGSRLAVCTNRVWVSEDFGAHWFTVPSKSDPRGTDPSGKVRSDTGQDVFYKDARAEALAARWNGEDELYVLNGESVQRFTRAPGTDTWTHAVVTAQHNKCFDYTESDIKGPKMPHLPPLGDWSDLAVHLPGPGGTSTLYVACTSLNSTPKMDTLWWYDGVSTWHATKLREAVKAPALAVAVHPVDSDTVFVGTTAGVWKGAFSHPGGADPTWAWTQFSSGLPEAAVQDLAFFRDPASGAPTMLLLRAALQSRGAWELDLLAPCDEKTYLRVHPLDTRRRPVTPLAKPMSALAVDFDPFASPDILIRPAPPVSAATMPAPPADAFFPLDKSHHSWGFELWTFQTAFRQLEPSCRPTGNWTKTFEALLVDYKSANGLGAAPAIDKPTWTNVVTQARVYRPPWDGPSPTEADLEQLVMGETFTITPTRFRARRLSIDVLVHHRGLQQVQPPSVSVLLLLRKLNEPEAAWPGLPIGATWKTATVSALNSGSAPGGGWPGNWVIADATPVRHPAGNLDAARPQAATFQLVFPPATPAGKYMLLAVCSSVTAKVTAGRLAGATLGDLLVQSPHVAAHRLELR